MEEFARSQPASFPSVRPDETFLRSEELAFLWGKLSRERGGSVLVHGPRGAGKCRLLGELVRRARGTEVLVLEARTPRTASASFAPFAAIAREAVTWTEQQGSSEWIDPLLQGLEPALGPDGAGAAGPSLERKLVFFDAMRKLLLGIADRTRLLVVVHDLERADADTLDLAQDLAEGFAGEPLEAARPGLLVLSLSDDDQAETATDDLVAELRERRPDDVLFLGRLDLEGLRRYLDSPRVLEKLLAASNGLPREIDELLEALPSNVEELYARRLSALDELSRELLYALALASAPASARIVAEVSGYAHKDVARALTALRDSRILDRSIENGELRFGFARRSNLEATLAAIPEPIATRFHGRWARALLDEPGRPAGARVIAHHLLRSEDPVAGVGMAIRAGEAHAVAGAHAAASQAYGEALPHAKGELRAQILEQLARLAAIRGERREALRRAEDWRAALGANASAAIVFEAELANASGDHDQALRVVEEASPIVSDDAPERVELEIARSEALYQKGRLDEARAGARRGLKLLEANDSARGRIELVNLLGKIALADDDVEEALACFDETLRLAEASGLARAEARALVNIGLAHMRVGREAQAEASLENGIVRATAAGEVSHLAFGHLNLGVLAHQRSELGRALTSYRAALGLFRRLGNKTQLARVLYNLANLSFGVGDLDRAEAYNGEALRIAETGGVERLFAIALALDGSIAAERGDFDLAAKRLREAMIHQRRLGTERPVETLADLAEVELRAGEPAVAAQILAELSASRTKVKSSRIHAKVLLLDAKIKIAAKDPAAVEAAREASQVKCAEDRLLRSEVETTMGRAFLVAGDPDSAKAHLLAADRIRKELAKELPEELRPTFFASRAQLDLERALEDADGTHRKRIESSRSPVDGARPRARSPEWDRRYSGLIGHSPKLLKVFHILDRVARSDSTVLILGESGTGKELVAEALHRSSARSSGPFVKLNCGALVETLLLSELFGHERGSFTGAHQKKAGRFEMAAGGTIFLDEIGDISPKTQVALLRVLQEREFERVGGGKPIKLEARVLCATNRNLLELVKQGTFREDLYYRLRGITLELPPLRERAEDIPELATAFLERHGTETGTPTRALSRGAEAMLARYAWPGNVRELENVVRSVALFADGAVIGPDDFAEYEELFSSVPVLSRANVPLPDPTEPPDPLTREGQPKTLAPRATHATVERASEPSSPEDALLTKILSGDVSLSELKKKLQEEAIARALNESQGNITRAAEKLGMKRPRLSQIINGNEALKRLCQEVSR
ncbi:MAG: sigma 54-interacting transcriptional regulator [Deltaproteobacteria bacterium]|nr:sigma 54-interacting transcriptional regulator [Deltaproteobacteria bacterium]